MPLRKQKPRTRDAGPPRNLPAVDSRGGRSPSKQSPEIQAATGKLSRWQRRRIISLIEKTIRTDGDRCSLCRAAFQHNTRSFGGLTSDGAAALVGKCCLPQLEIIFIEGLYLTRKYNVSDLRPLSPEQIEETITARQQQFALTDAINAAIALRAGLPHLAEKLTFHSVAAGNADQVWFEKHPARSHRLRPLLPNEFAGDAAKLTPPPGHELQVLVRQIEPGMRIRSGFYRNLEIPIPDSEPIIRALFELMARRESGAISVEEVLKYAEQPK
jgi:hypothetical protein